MAECNCQPVPILSFSETTGYRLELKHTCGLGLLPVDLAYLKTAQGRRRDHCPRCGRGRHEGHCDFRVVRTRSQGGRNTREG